MTPVFANSAWVSAPERILRRGGSWHRRRLRVRYGLFVRPGIGPVLIDTGYTPHSVTARDRSLPLKIYDRLIRPTLNPDGQPDVVLRRFGYSPADVTAVIVTHFHVDHISGLSAFPNATFIASRSGWESLCKQHRIKALRHGLFRELLPPDFEDRLCQIEDQPKQSWAGFTDGYDLFHDGQVLAIPLPGHAAGQCGVLFPQAEVPLLYAADVQWLIEALPKNTRAHLAPRLIADEPHKLDQSTDQVATFRAAGGAVVLCHDDAVTPFDIEAGAVM